MADEKHPANDFYAPANPRARSTAEAYRDACAEQAKAMRHLAATLREAIQRINHLDLYPPADELIRKDQTTKAIVEIGSVENALRAIAAGLDASAAT